MPKKRVLFIGSFQSKSSSGHVGGQMFACNSLINSGLSDEIEWILVDTTASTNLKRSIVNRSYQGVKRLLIFTYHLLFSRVDTVMAFCSSGYSFLEKGFMIKMAKALGKKTVLAPRSGFLIDNIESSESFRKKVAAILSKSDFIICQGTFWKTFFRQKFNIPRDKLKVINNWIDSSKYVSNSTASVGTLNLLFLGWVEQNKGIWDLLEAMKSLHDKDVVLTIAGGGSQYDEFVQAVKSADLEEKIKFAGWVLGKDKMRLISVSDVFILPSYREGLPNSLLEAMASRKAVIVSDVGAVSDVIEDKVNGHLIESGEVSQIVDSVLTYYEDRDTISLFGNKAYDTVTSKNSLDAVLPKFKAILL